MAQFLTRLTNNNVVFLESKNGNLKYISYISDNYIEEIYTQPDIRLVPIIINDTRYLIDPKNIPPGYTYSNRFGSYIKGRSDQSIQNVRYAWGYGSPQVYNFSKLDLNYWPHPQFQSNDKMKELFQFTYGFEFETCNGRIPEQDCFNNGLVPLFDGSIQGYEYVTFPLNSKEVLDAIKQNISLLSTYTQYDKNCSIHMHVGGYPTTISAIKLLLRNWYKFQNIISSYLPLWTYNTQYFKSSEKSYCKTYSVVNFQSFYKTFTGNTLEDDSSLFWENQYDEGEHHKWSVNGRYFNMNIMHLISGKDHKTVEFRFLHPTIHYVEIQLWTLILSAFLKYTISMYSAQKYKCVVSMNKVLSVFSDEIKKAILEKLDILRLVVKLQTNFYDYSGFSSNIKDTIFDIINFNTPICVD